MENFSKAIVILLNRCLKEDLKGLIEFKKDDFNEIGFVSSESLTVLLRPESTYKKCLREE